MSRRKPMAVRDPCGRIKHTPSELMGPTEIRRLVESASAGLRDATFGSMAGRLHLTGKITASQYAAAKRWSALTADYATACQCPQPPRTISLDPSGGTPSDPDSDAGARQARYHEKAVRAFLDGRHALRLAGRDAERVVEDVCVRDLVPVGYSELEALRNGLQALSAYWSANRKAHAR
jgi:hypothetical protein